MAFHSCLSPSVKVMSPNWVSGDAAAQPSLPRCNFKISSNQDNRIDMDQSRRTSVKHTAPALTRKGFSTCCQTGCVAREGRVNMGREQLAEPKPCACSADALSSSAPSQGTTVGAHPVERNRKRKPRSRGLFGRSERRDAETAIESGIDLGCSVRARNT